MSSRNLIERRLLNSRPNTTRYRNLLRAERPLRLRNLDLRFFIANEVFFDSAAGAWSRNRFSTGGNYSFSKSATLEVYYLRQSDGSARPGDINVIGTTFRFQL